jgi:hypothetical protein
MPRLDECDSRGRFLLTGTFERIEVITGVARQHGLRASLTLLC